MTDKKPKKSSAKKSKMIEVKVEPKKEDLKCQEYLESWKKERADFLNYKKEESERIGQIVKYSNETMLLEIILILDNIYLAEAHVPKEIEKNSWIEGFKHIKNQLCDFLQRHGVETIKTVGEKFNPVLMEAIEEIEEKGKEAGMVAQEIQKGYTMGGKIIRPAKVRVTK